MVCALRDRAFYRFYDGFLINHFGLGSTELGAQKSCFRAWLLNAYEFNIWALCVGIAIGVLFESDAHQCFTCSGRTLNVLGLFAHPYNKWPVQQVLLENKEDYYPFWSGIFCGKLDLDACEGNGINNKPETLRVPVFVSLIMRAEGDAMCCGYLYSSAFLNVLFIR